MTTALQCWALIADFNLGFLFAYGALLVVLGGGAIIIWLAYRWHRTLKQPTSEIGNDLAQLSRTIESQETLVPDEVERVRAAIDRQRGETKT